MCRCMMAGEKDNKATLGNPAGQPDQWSSTFEWGVNEKGPNGSWVIARGSSKVTVTGLTIMSAEPESSTRRAGTGNWIYEMKFDGYRALAIKADKEVRLISRNRKSFNDDYPVLIDSLKSLKTKSFIIDGEITALDENGRSSFQLLQGYGKGKRTPLVYYAFDLLSLDSTDLLSRPLIEH